MSAQYSSEAMDALGFFVCLFVFIACAVCECFICFSLSYGQENKSKLISGREKIEEDTNKGIIPSLPIPKCFLRTRFIPTLPVL